MRHTRAAAGLVRAGLTTAGLTTAGLVMVWVAAAGALWAQQPLASVSSPASFTLRGVAVTPNQGVASWPLMPGDGIKAGSAPVLVNFANGSVITLDPGSEAKVDLAAGKPQFQLLSGSARYTLISPGAVSLMQGSKPVKASALSGVITQGSLPAAAGSGGAAGGGFWTAGHTALVAVGVAAATGASIGVAEAVSGGSSTSPH